MRRLRAFLVRLAGLFRTRESELREEIESNLELHIEDNLRAGMTPEQARREALLKLGGIEQAEEAYRDRRGIPVLQHLVRDLRYALRQLRRNPAFTAVVVLSLALGIGANSAIFSILNALILKSLPVAAPEQLFLVQQQSSIASAFPQRFSYPMFQRLRDTPSRARGLAAMSRNMNAQTLIDGAAQPEPASVQLVSGEFFPLLSLPPALGRTLAPGDNRPGHDRVAVIAYGFWQRRFAATRDILGRRLTINGASVTIVGVVGEGFRGIWIESPTDIWIPLTAQPDVRYSQNFSSHNLTDPEHPWPPQESIDWLDIIVRVQPASAGAAREALNSAFVRSLENLTGTPDPRERRYLTGRTLTFESLGRGLSRLRERFTTPLLALMAMVALVLLIACANTANLLLAQSEGRRREMAVRLSIGAGRARLLQQLLTESVLLVALAACLGLLLARWAGDWLVRRALGVTTGPTPLAAGLDRHVLLFTMGISTLTVLLFGLAPALRAIRTNLSDAMKSASRTVSGASRLNPAKFLVAAQVALSLIVICAAGLFARSLQNLVHADLGFDREHVLSVWMSPRTAGYQGERLNALYGRLIERAQSVPGVRSAAISMCGLVVECRSSDNGIRIEGYTPGPRERPGVQYSAVSPGYFSTVGLVLRAGRDFNARDNSRALVIVNEAFVRRYIPRGDPLGKRFGTNLESQIIGVIQDARVNRVREGAAPMMYMPLEGNLVYASTLEVRAAGDPQAIATDVRKAVAEVAPDLPIERITRLTELVDRSLNQERLISVLTLAFAGLALGLACFGLYGVMSYTVTRRTSEIGIRMALGAQPGSVLWIVFKEAFGLIVLGLLVGIPIVMLSSRSLTALLYEVAPNDVATLFSAILFLTAVALAASFLPAWRASRVNPVLALRNE